MRKLLFFNLVLILAIGVLGPATAAAQSDSEQPVVHAILFYSPTCPHCHLVIKELLVPMVDKYGDQLQIIGIDTTQPDGGQLYQAAIDHFQIAPERRGVPTLIIKDIVLVGSGEIPEQFPGLVEEGLASGGIGWPDLPGFAPELAVEAQAEPTAQAQSTPTSSPIPTPESAETASEQAVQTEPEVALMPAPTGMATPTSAESLLAINQPNLATSEAQVAPPDPVGTALAAVILAGMVLALLYALWRVTLGAPPLSRSNHNTFPRVTSWLIPALSVLGLLISIYLAYVEINQIEAVCGPVGNCNIVQTSPYAQIIGIPIAVLGLVNYVAIIVIWGVQKYGAGSLANLATLALVGLTIFGTGFSIYLTLLEIFVIHAICAWCLSSAVITTILMLLVVAPITNQPRVQRALSH